MPTAVRVGRFFNRPKTPTACMGWGARRRPGMVASELQAGAENPSRRRWLAPARASISSLGFSFWAVVL
jgi:hypothetical protein